VRSCASSQERLVVAGWVVRQLHPALRLCSRDQPLRHLHPGDRWRHPPAVAFRLVVVRHRRNRGGAAGPADCRRDSPRASRPVRPARRPRSQRVAPTPARWPPARTSRSTGTRPWKCTGIPGSWWPSAERRSSLSRSRSARVSVVPMHEAVRRLHPAKFGDRPDPPSPPHPRALRRRTESPSDAGPREPGRVTRHTPVRRRPDHRMRTRPLPTPRPRARARAPRAPRARRIARTSSRCGKASWPMRAAARVAQRERSRGVAALGGNDERRPFSASDLQALRWSTGRLPPRRESGRRGGSSSGRRARHRAARGRGR